MIDQHDRLFVVEETFVDWVPGLEDHEPLLFEDTTFTRSNGTTFARIYERLTKASRRRQFADELPRVYLEMEAQEEGYRQGVYDTLAALQEEL
jgi:hypothetical protein